LALTGSVGTGLGLSLAGGLLFLGLAAMYVRRKSTVIAD
jgi:hypothetical protein